MRLKLYILPVLGQPDAFSKMTSGNTGCCKILRFGSNVVFSQHNSFHLFMQKREKVAFFVLVEICDNLKLFMSQIYIAHFVEVVKAILCYTFI